MKNKELKKSLLKSGCPKPRFHHCGFGQLRFFLM